MTVEITGLVPGGPRLVIATREDVLAQLPSDVLSEQEQPVLDAAADALLAIALAYQEYGGRCAANCDPDRAEDQSLRAVAADRGSEQADGEDQELFRNRMLGIQASVTFEAIRDAVNAILASWTDKTCRILESGMDGAFLLTAVTDATSDWHSFVARTASYPDRMYEDDAAVNGGVYFAGRGGTGLHLFFATTRRLFVILLPSLAQIRGNFFYTAVSDVGAGTFLYLAATDPGVTFMGSDGGTAQAIYRAIANKVDSLVGQSISYSIIEDRSL